MTAAVLIFQLFLVSGLQPGDPWPPEVDSAMVQALDSIGISREQLDFDRHWASGVHMADSTVITALQNIGSLPLILRQHLEDIGDYTAEGSQGGMQDMVTILRILERSDSLLIDASSQLSAETTDSLAAIVPALWLSEDDPLKWNSVLEEWGIDTLAREVQMDTLAALMERYPGTVEFPVAAIVRAARGLEFAQWPAELSVTLPGVTGTTVSFSFEGPVRWVVGGSGDNFYGMDCPFELIVDIGGDDVYGDGIGGAVGPMGRRISVVIDLHGEDTYSSDSPFSQGCGMMGVGGILDMEGDDVYRAGDFSQGAGIMGVGFLLDLSGEDFMRAGTFCQGAGCMGRGMLYDGSGDDFRQADLFGQGFGGPGGYGLLADMQGCDCNMAGFRYSHEPLLPDDNQAMSQGFGMGLRPLIAGGIGLMADFGDGNDTYRAEVFGQGCSYFYSLGMLYDQSGQDSYVAAQYSQGSGIHLAAGCLWDGDGDDSYYSRNGPAQGSAHDLSTGFLLDGGGSDWYCSDGGQSLSLTNSASIFIDMEGNDTYCARGGGQGEARWARGSSGAALFIDLADADSYSGDGGDSVIWLGREYGVGIDLPAVTPGGLVPQDEVGDPESLDLDSLFSVASEWEVGPNNDRVIAHREELARRGEEAVIYLIDNHMGTLSGLESRAMEKVFGDNHDVSLELLIRQLGIIDSLTSREGGNLVYFLGKLEDPGAREPLESLLISRRDTIPVGLSVGIIKALGSIGDTLSIPVIAPFAEDSSSRVRREVAVSLGKMLHEDAAEVLEALSEDLQLDVRSAAESALRELEKENEIVMEPDE